MGRTQSAGNRGEAAVARYLRQKGYTLLESQWRCRFGELDLVARDRHSTVCIVEVKLRASVSHGLPEETVTPRKQEKLRLTAEIYLQTHETNKQPRFDVVALYAKDGMETCPLPVRHIKNAF